MKKKQIKHFVLNKDSQGNGVPVCNCFGVSFFNGNPLRAWVNFSEVAKTRRGVTCGNCRRTRVFRNLK